MARNNSLRRVECPSHLFIDAHMRIHKVHTLHIDRLARSTKPFNARGAKVNRCRYCQVNIDYCICAHQPQVTSNAAFLLIMFDTEVLKPSNTGKLIADVVQETYAYLWSRTEPDQQMLELLNDPQWQPFVVFPGDYVQPPQQVVSKVEMIDGKRPLFIMLDGSWREACKIFRRSPYLNRFPVLSIKADQLSKYIMRKASKDYQLATAEVAAVVLELFGELETAKHMELWFDVFKEHYLCSKQPLKLADRNVALNKMFDYQRSLNPE